MEGQAVREIVPAPQAMHWLRSQAKVEGENGLTHHPMRHKYQARPITHITLHELFTRHQFGLCVGINSIGRFEFPAGRRGAKTLQAAMLIEGTTVFVSLPFAFCLLPFAFSHFQSAASPVCPAFSARHSTPFRHDEVGKLASFTATIPKANDADIHRGTFDDRTICLTVRKE